MRIKLIASLACVFAFSVAAAQTPPAQSEAQAQESPARAGGFSLDAIARQARERLDAANATSEFRGSGPYPALMETDMANPNVVLYRPADLSPFQQRKLGLIIWGNGGCSDDAASARLVLAEMASHGYLVVAPGRALTGPTAMGAADPAPMQISAQDMLGALDWALAENDNRGSVFYRLIDEDAIAASGHSCGGILSIILGADPRIDAVVLQSAAINPTIPDRAPLVQHYQRLRGLHTPILMVMGGESDILWQLGQDTYERLTHVPVTLASIDRGHGLTFRDPHGGAAAQLAVQWLEWQLRGNREAGRTFVGESCGLCTDPQWSVQRRGMPSR